MSVLVTRIEYLVSQFIEVVDCDTGQVIDYHSDEEYFTTYSEACKYADKLRKFIGEEICSWGDSIGILREVYCDDEPRGFQYYE